MGGLPTICCGGGGGGHCGAPIPIGGGGLERADAACGGTCIGGKGTLCGGGGRSTGIGPGGTVPFAKGRGGTGAPIAPLAWGPEGSDGGALANKVWGLLFWAFGLLAAKTLSVSQEWQVKFFF
ncbi:hypothetical protein QQP08_002381 [Theobroma cacao]|nr:hypothetical protein QQP08_002381 [Theobroma cacao]